MNLMVFFFQGIPLRIVADNPRVVWRQIGEVKFDDREHLWRIIPKNGDMDFTALDVLLHHNGRREFLEYLAHLFHQRGVVTDD